MGCARWGVCVIAVAAMASQGGCRNEPPPPRVPVPVPQNREALRDYEMAKPMPDQRSDMRDFRTYDDVPLNSERPPEQREFVDAYNHVGKPRIVVFVNRTLEGNLVPVNEREPLVSVEKRRSASAGVTTESRESRGGGYYHDDRTDRFESKGPGEYRERTDVYLRQGQYDDAQARSIDYEAMENILTDWLACNGAVTVVSPVMGPKRLTREQLDDLQAGRPGAMADLVRNLDADVLIQVQAKPTRQTPEGLEVRVIGEAINARGGESIGRAVVDVPPPLDKIQMNRYTRFLARKLMDDMSGAWMNGPPPRGAEGAPPPPPPERDRDGERGTVAPGPAPGTR